MITVEGEVSVKFTLSPEEFQEWRAGIERQAADMLKGLMTAMGHEVGDVRITVKASDTSPSKP